MKLQRELYHAKKELGIAFLDKEAQYEGDEKVEEKEATKKQSEVPKKAEARVKTDPFLRSKQIALERSAERASRQADYEKRQLERQQKLQKRSKESKLLSKRTKKGQPIMKNQIDHLLQKIIDKKL